jgi:hypothetical protein
MMRNTMEELLFYDTTSYVVSRFANDLPTVRFSPNPHLCIFTYIELAPH